MYTEWYFKLCDLCERNSVRLKPLDSAEAAHLEITSDMHSTRLRSDFMTRSGTAAWSKRPSLQCSSSAH